MVLVTFFKCHSLPLPSRIHSSLIRGRFECWWMCSWLLLFFSFVELFSTSWAMFFKMHRHLINSECFFPSPHRPHHIKEVASGFLFCSSPVAHISSCHAKHQRESKKEGGEGEEWIYSTCLRPQVGYARHAHRNMTWQSTKLKQFNRWQNCGDMKQTLYQWFQLVFACTSVMVKALPFQKALLILSTLHLSEIMSRNHEMKVRS